MAAHKLHSRIIRRNILKGAASILDVMESNRMAVFLAGIIALLGAELVPTIQAAETDKEVALGSAIIIDIVEPTNSFIVGQEGQTIGRPAHHDTKEYLNISALLDNISSDGYLACDVSTHTMVSTHHGEHHLELTNHNCIFCMPERLCEAIPDWAASGKATCMRWVLECRAEHCVDHS